MCFGGCGSLGHCTGSIAYILEKLVSYIAMTAVVLCIVLTVTISLGLGVGLGYNYCFVDLKVLKDPNGSGTPTETPRETPSETLTENPTENPTETPTETTAFAADPVMVQEVDPTDGSRRMLPMPAIKQKMVLPLHGDFDFLSILSKLRRRNQNVTLELIT